MDKDKRYRPKLFFADGYWRIDRNDPASEFKKLSQHERWRLNRAYDQVDRLNRDPMYIAMRNVYYERMRIARRQQDTNPQPTIREE